MEKRNAILWPSVLTAVLLCHLGCGSSTPPPQPKFVAPVAEQPVAAPPAPPAPLTPPVEQVTIPKNGNWVAQSNNQTALLESGGGDLKLRARMQGSEAYVELFLDMRDLDFPPFRKTANRTHDFSNTEVSARVKGDVDFRGDPQHPNIVVILMKNSQWRDYKPESIWMNASSAMTSADGMRVHVKLGDDEMSRDIAGMSIHFAIGRYSNVGFSGIFTVDSVLIRRETAGSLQR
jgi:hypothetical protein